MMETGEDALEGDIENLALDRPPPLSQQHAGGVPDNLSLSAATATDIEEIIENEIADDILAEKEQVCAPASDDAVGVVIPTLPVQTQDRKSSPRSIDEIGEQTSPDTGPGKISDEQQSVEAAKENKRNMATSCLKQRSPERGHTSPKRSVSFPDGPSVVTLTIDPVDPWKDAKHCTSAEVISEYKKACEKLKTKPIEKLVRQIQDHPDLSCRIATMSLKGTKMDTKACESLESIFKRIQFEVLDIENCSLEEEGATAILEMVEFYQSACKINLAYNPKMGMRGWQTLCRMLRKTPCVYYLDARRTMLTDQTMPMFGRCLKADPFLKILHLEGIFLSGRPLLILTTAMKYNTILEELYLGDNDLTSADGVSIGAMLSANTSLQLLDLRNNALRDPGLVHIANGLIDQANAGENGIASLVLWNINLSHEAMFHFSDAMAKTLSLKSLNLGHNRIGDIGVQKLKPGLIRNRSLKRLGLLNTKLGNEGAVALAEILADSMSLTRIDVRENNVQVAGLMALSLALKVNHSLVRLDLDKEMKKEPGLETVQQTVLSDIYNYCHRNKQMAKDTLSRQSSVSEDSETSLTEESGAKLQRSVSSPAVATTVEAKEGLVTSLKSLVSESGPIKDIVGTFTTLTFDSSASTANSSKRALASADNSPKSSQASAIKQNDLTGRSRFTITRIFESIGNVSADVANRIGLDTVALSKAKKVGRSGSTDQDLKSIYSKSHKIENNPNEDDFDNLPESYVKNGDDIEHDEGESLSSSPQESSHQDVNDTTSNNADEHLGSSSQKGTENSHKKEREDSSAGANAANAVSGSVDLPHETNNHVDYVKDHSSANVLLSTKLNGSPPRSEQPVIN